MEFPTYSGKNQLQNPHGCNQGKSNLESINAMLTAQEIPQNERLIQLNKMAISQMRSLLNLQQ